MSSDLNVPVSTVAVKPIRRIRPWIFRFVFVLPVIAIGMTAWGSGFDPERLWKEESAPLELLDVDEGRLEVTVTEAGMLESANHSTIKSRVQALVRSSGGSYGGGRRSYASNGGVRPSPAPSRGSTGGASTSFQRPAIRSFTYQVPGYRSLRTSAASRSVASTTCRILSIKPEGSFVRAGEIVCELDSSEFREELEAQQIRQNQAKSAVEQVKSIFEVNEITLREYRDGIYPQDRERIRQFIQASEIEYERAKRNEAWSKETLGKGFRAAAQYQADYLKMKQAELVLREAESTEQRLIKFTSSRVLKTLQAKLESIRADMLAQEVTFATERDRTRRLQRMIDFCTIRAPRDGVIVYANESNAWSGRTESRIEEGVKVREGQALFDLLDSKNMRVRAKINESKMASIRPGQKAEVRIDAFPDRPLIGTVGEVTPIPAPSGRYSDIRVYFATIKLDTGGFTGLRPGLTSQVSLLVDSKERVTRIPVQAIRFEAGKPFAAIATKIDDETRWAWQALELGLMSESHAQVVKGLRPGDKVVAEPNLLSPGPKIPKTKALPQKPNGSASSKVA